MTIESAPDLPSQLAVKVMHEIGSNDPDLYGRLQETLNAALAAAPQPDDEWPVIPDTPEERAYRKGWNEGMTAGHKLVPVDDPVVPQPAPADREALVEVIKAASGRTMGENVVIGGAGEIADALLARGLRLPGDETMAWAVLGEDGKMVAINYDRMTAQHLCNLGERIERVAIRVVEGGDDAA